MLHHTWHTMQKLVAASTLELSYVITRRRSPRPSMNIPMIKCNHGGLMQVVCMVPHRTFEVLAPTLVVAVHLRDKSCSGQFGKLRTAVNFRRLRTTVNFRRTSQILGLMSLLVVLVVLCSLPVVRAPSIPQGFSVDPLSPPAYHKESCCPYSKCCYHTANDNASYCAC